MNIHRPRAILTEEQNLAEVRARSCYKTLRLVINVTFALSVAMLLYYLCNGLTQGSGEESLAMLRLAIIVQVGVYFVLCVAGRQMASLLVDIADVLISEHNRNRNR